MANTLLPPPHLFQTQLFLFHMLLQAVMINNGAGSQDQRYLLSLKLCFFQMLDFNINIL